MRRVVARAEGCTAPLCEIQRQPEVACILRRRRRRLDREFSRERGDLVLERVRHGALRTHERLPARVLVGRRFVNRGDAHVHAITEHTQRRFDRGNDATLLCGGDRDLTVVPTQHLFVVPADLNTRVGRGVRGDLAVADVCVERVGLPCVHHLGEAVVVDLRLDDRRVNLRFVRRHRGRLRVRHRKQHSTEELP